MERMPQENPGATTLVVDLDGTLIRTDLLWESFFVFVSRRPLQIPALLRALVRGRLHFKNFLAEHVEIDPRTIPYNPSVIEFIKQEKIAGVKNVVLASASSAAYVKAVAEHVGYFSAWHGSESMNLKGHEKLALILDRYGPNSRYVGDSSADVPIWRELGEALAVSPSRWTRKRLGAADIPIRIIEQSPPSRRRAIVKALRPHQWAKNALVLLPFLAAHKFFNLNAWGSALIATFAFCLIASCTYVLNDLLDLSADRAHPEKRNRPFASGALELWWGVVLIPLLFFSAAFLSFLLPKGFGITLALYFAANIFYSIWLKRVHSVDLVLLAAMYTARLVAGGEATAARITPWLGAFSVFFFFGLAALKRFTEISSMLQRKSVGRGYYQDDKIAVLVLGIASSLLSSLVLALYLNNPQVSKLYGHPDRLWLLLPVLLFWTSQIWIAAGRGEVRSDPVLYALKSKQSYVVALAAAVCIWISI